MIGEFIYSNGLNISQSRKVFKFYFGDFFLKADKNNKNLRFDIYLKNRIKNDNDEILLIEDWVDLEYFNKYWNNGKKDNPPFNVILLSASF